MAELENRQANMLAWRDYPQCRLGWSLWDVTCHQGIHQTEQRMSWLGVRKIRHRDKRVNWEVLLPIRSYHIPWWLCHRWDKEGMGLCSLPQRSPHCSQSWSFQYSNIKHENGDRSRDSDYYLAGVSTGHTQWYSLPLRACCARYKSSCWERSGSLFWKSLG